jgi:transcriptional regulator with XRE-family HTH domain
MNQQKNALGNKIKELREKNHLKQGELAELVGLSSQFISFIERGERSAKTDTLKKLAEFFKVESEELITLRDEQLSYPTNIYQTGQPEEYPSYIKEFVEELLKIDESVCKEEIQTFRLQMNERLFNLLQRLELKEVKLEILNLRNKWTQIDFNHKLSIDMSQNHVGYLPLETKVFLLFSYDSTNALKVSLLAGDHSRINIFEQWMGQYHIKYITEEKIPHMSNNQKLVNFVWFSPFLSSFERFRYLLKEEIKVDSANCNDIQLSWYLKPNTTQDVV